MLENLLNRYRSHVGNLQRLVHGPFESGRMISFFSASRPGRAKGISAILAIRSRAWVTAFNKPSTRRVRQAENDLSILDFTATDERPGGASDRLRLA